MSYAWKSINERLKHIKKEMELATLQKEHYRLFFLHMLMVDLGEEISLLAKDYAGQVSKFVVKQLKAGD